MNQVKNDAAVRALTPAQEPDAKAQLPARAADLTTSGSTSEPGVGGDRAARFDGGCAPVHRGGVEPRARLGSQTSMLHASGVRARPRQQLLVVALLASACVTADESSDDGLAPYDVCDTGGPEADGQWDEEQQDWVNVSEDGENADNLTDPCGNAGPLASHHCFLTAVHAVHMHTGELLLYHGERDTRVWPLDGDGPEDMRWHPTPYYSEWLYPSGTCPGPGCQLLTASNVWPDTFCSGHVQLRTGRVMVGGGNVDGNGGSGGLRDTFLFDPEALTAQAPATSATCPFGWATEVDGGQHVNAMPRMTYDRWYPTLILLGDGRVLIAGGNSNADVAGGSVPGEAQTTRWLEVYDPTPAMGSPFGTIAVVEDPYPGVNDPPNYPLLFLLPNGDVFYAGGDGAATSEFVGRVLIPDYNNGGVWEWHDHEFDSNISGGSAVMFRPGEILKAGGQDNSDNTTNLAERIDLSSIASGDYDFAPETPDDPLTPNRFVEADAMAFARHFHTLTALPDGKVAVTGGNTQGNGETGEYFRNPCTDEIGTPLDEIDCEDGCRSTCEERYPDVSLTNYGSCDVPDDVMACTLLERIDCCAGRAEAGNGACASVSGCEWDAMTGTCNEASGPDRCGEAMQGASCVSGRCDKTCTSDANCPDIQPVGGECLLQSLDDLGEPTGMCGVYNNACYATKAVEIYDPACDVWTTLEEQDYERMYHSTTLLQPDGRLISMGNGHRNFGWRPFREGTTAEYFVPRYAVDTNAPKPVFEFGEDVPTTPGGTAYWQYGTSIELAGGPATEVAATEAVLVRPGSVTHGFDMAQRFVGLDFDGEVDGNANRVYTLRLPDTEYAIEHTVPPGYYMLFLLSAAREPSIAQYVLIDENPPVSMICAAGSGLSATETSCDEEPVGGVCPSSGIVTSSAPLPTVDGPTGPVTGFEVYTHPGIVENPSAPTADELTAIQDRCETACEAYFASQPGQTATCSSSSAFQTPFEFRADVKPALDLVSGTARNGAGIFGTQSLSCDLGIDCYTAFDERLSEAVPSRLTTTDAPLGVGEEYSVALGTASRIQVVTNKGTYSVRLTGSVGYSFCRDGSASAPCPFYLGSINAVAASTMSPKMTCADSTEQQITISNLLLGLAQPAYGIAAQGTTVTSKGFPAGSLVLDTAFDVGTAHFTAKRATRDHTIVTASGTSFNAIDVTMTVTVPCNTSTSTVTIKLTLRNPTNGSALGRPPTVSITTPSSVSCTSPTTLAATVTDPNNDVDDTRWYVDGVLLAPSVTTMLFTGTHELRAVARDERGAATTAKKVVSCL